MSVERSRGECGACGQWHGVGSWPSQDNSGGSCLNGGAASSPFQMFAKASHRVRRRMSHRQTMRKIQLCWNKQTDDLKKKTSSWLNRNVGDTVCRGCNIDVLAKQVMEKRGEKRYDSSWKQSWNVKLNGKYLNAIISTVIFLNFLKKIELPLTCKMGPFKMCKSWGKSSVHYINASIPALWISQVFWLVCHGAACLSEAGGGGALAIAL